jgi:hypothetical protein
MRCRKIDVDLLLKIERGERAALRQLPLFGEDHRLLPHVFRKQLEAHPYCFPVRDLAEKHCRGEIVDCTSLRDCQAIAFCPVQGQDYWHNYWPIIYTTTFRTLHAGKGVFSGKYLHQGYEWEFLYD